MQSLVTSCPRRQELKATALISVDILQRHILEQLEYVRSQLFVSQLPFLLPLPKWSVVL